jgi:hypothetical protein
VPRWTLAVGLVAALAVGCGGSHAATSGRARAKTDRPTSVMVGSGKLVGIGGGRSLYLDCVGSGTPTVVLEAGLGGKTDMSDAAWLCQLAEAGLLKANFVPPKPIRDLRRTIASVSTKTPSAQLHASRCDHVIRDASRRPQAAQGCASQPRARA